ncbi:ligase [Paenibacillus oryzae]|uniref:Ligase n=1 Tax=Paenibacillus oryzae TaxID=1844972 RepID=A0A1A5YEV5_9BACL|nr:biotin/lipoate A/B protein ligase family protein [Paenibacillus oryzae]OBR64102.1 ligase [Paenibacillus oryzae]
MAPIGKNILLLDRSSDLSQPDPLYAFAMDELLCRSAGNGGPAVCHLWRQPRAFILGSRDNRLPYADKAKQWLQANGWLVMVRNSGGAAVPLDGGVVNLSLILPKNESSEAGYNGDFETMYRLIARALQHTNKAVKKGEVQGAYCPGDFDLSIGGYKFCGIAQRRQVHAAIIQAFVVAEGSGRERAEFVRSFYNIASDNDNSLGHPIVTGESTASLEELTELGPQAAASFVQAVKDVIRQTQTTEGLREASARLRMPSSEDLQGMISQLRARYN